MSTYLPSLLLGLLFSCNGIVVYGVDSSPEQLDSCTALENLVANDDAEKVYRVFNHFCQAHFGANHEPLVYEKFGKNISLLDDGTWVFVSEHSAVIAFESNIPAYSHVEFSSNGDFSTALHTVPKERPFYLHLHHLKDLDADTLYQWRAVLIDETGQTLQAKARSFQTLNEHTLIKIPDDKKQMPYIIDQPGHYVLTHDIHAKRTAIEIRSSNVILDLGGHTVHYAQEQAVEGHFTDKWMNYVHKGFFGIKCIDHSNITIVNGTIIQSDGDNRGNDESTGFNPLYLRGISNVELAGLEIDYHTPQITGIRNRGASGDYHIHHNLIRDRGTKMHNRHGSGCSSIDFIGSKDVKPVYHHNLIARTRQNGLRGSPLECYNNEVYVDSWATNSFAISIGPGRTLKNNRLFATGYHAIACPWGDGIQVVNNFIHMQGINTGKKRWWEGFGDQNSMNGLRHTQWGENTTPSDNSLYENNVICIYGRNGAQIRGVEFFSDTYIKNLTLKDSIVKVISQDELTTKACCIATHGNPKREDTQNPVMYLNNTFISNINIIRIGDDYGKGSHHHFFNNHFVRIDALSSFHTFTAMGTYYSRYHRLIDTIFGEGTAADDVDWTSTAAGSRNYDIEWSLHLSASANTPVRINDAKGVSVYTGQIGNDGTLSIPLKQFRMSRDEKTVYTPHTITIGDQIRNVTMDNSQTINF